MHDVKLWPEDVVLYTKVDIVSVLLYHYESFNSKQSASR